MKAWVVAVTVGDGSEAVGVAATWYAEAPEIATAQVVSEFYVKSGHMLPVIAVAVHELTIDFAEDLLATLRGEKAKSSIVPFRAVRGALAPETPHTDTEELCDCGGVIIFDDQNGVAHCNSCGSRESYTTTPAMRAKAREDT